MLEFQRDTATRDQIRDHLQAVSIQFEPPLSSYVDIEAYSSKLHEFAVTFEAWDEGKLVGFVAAYFDPEGSGKGFISNFSVLKLHLGQGISGDLMVEMLSYAAKTGVTEVDLEVWKNNYRAVAFYKKHRFVVIDDTGDKYRMSRKTGA